MDFYSYQCSGRRNGEMCGDEQKRVDGSIKMKLRMPTTQFAHLLICLFAYLTWPTTAQIRISLFEMAASFGRSHLRVPATARTHKMARKGLQSRDVRIAIVVDTFKCCSILLSVSCTSL